jgi:hypothetical protein
VKDLNELQAMRKYLLKHTVRWVQIQSTTEMKDRTHVLDWDKLSTYGQADLPQSVFVAREMPVELESENRFLHSVLGYL